MTGLGIAAALLLLLWCSLLYVPFRWRPVGLYLFSWKVLAVVYLPFITVIGVALAIVGVALRSWWVAVPAAVAAVAALVVMVRVGTVRVDLTGALGPGWENRIPTGRRRGMVRQWWTGPITRGAKPSVAPGRAVCDGAGHWTASCCATCGNHLTVSSRQG